DIVAQRFAWPEQTMRFVIIALSLGFFVTLVLAWYHGERGAQRVSGTELLILALLLAIGGGFLWRSAGTSPEKIVRQDAPNPTPSPAAAAVISEKSIAVLPFENLSDDKGAAYFAEGIQDEILTKLASVADLKVISRTSTAKYKSKPEDLKTVSQQLGVATVLEGSVQKAAEKVRVIVQLIDARADSHLWAKTYDRDLKDVFAIQSEIAQEIADSLQAKLSPAESRTLSTAPTKDPAAYDLFLKGEYEQRIALSTLAPESFDRAIPWYEQAIARDPDFALAMARLVVCRMRRHWLAEAATEPELVEIGKMAKAALTLAPDLADAHVALGVFHYYGFREYEPALAAFLRAVELQPNNSEALQFVAYVHRRLGKWDLCLEELTSSLKQDPRNASVVGNVAQTYCFLRRWKETEVTARKTLALGPREATSIAMLLLSTLNQGGDTQEAMRTLATFPPDDPLLSNSGTYSMVMGRRAEILVLHRDFAAALKTWETGVKETRGEMHLLSAKTAIRVLAGDLAGAPAEADRARQLLETRLRDRPGETRSMRALSWVYLALDRKGDAVKIAQQALDLLPPEKDAVVGVSNLTGLAEIKARTGATSEAVEILRRLLTMPAGEVVSIARLKADPVWDPIRHDPGFQQLLVGKEHVGP
ncbi:MAG: hypothetical protein ABI897_13185, partial [Spartobacteria bacterium]